MPRDCLARIYCVLVLGSYLYIFGIIFSSLIRLGMRLFYTHVTYSIFCSCSAHCVAFLHSTSGCKTVPTIGQVTLSSVCFAISPWWMCYRTARATTVIVFVRAIETVSRCRLYHLATWRHTHWNGIPINVNAFNHKNYRPLTDSCNCNYKTRWNRWQRQQERGFIVS